MNIIRAAAAGTLESSDALVTIEPSDELSIEIESVVIKQFGDQIDRAIREVLAEQAVEHAAVRIQDRGAVECTIKARVETAIKRAWEGEA